MDYLHIIQIGIILLAVSLILGMDEKTIHSKIFQASLLLITFFFAIFLFTKTSPSRSFADFKDAYFPAGQAVLSARSNLLPLLRENIEGFVNLPIVAYLFLPLALLPERAALAVFFAAGLISILVALLVLSTLCELDRRQQLALVIIAAGFGPLIYSLREGNLSHFVLATLLLAAFLIKQRKEISGGIFLGIAAVLKPPLAFFVIFYLLRGKNMLAVAMSTFLLASVAVSLVVFGPDMHFIWFEETILPSHNPIPAFNSQSADAVLLRSSLGPQSILDWSGHRLEGAFFLVSLAFKITATASLLYLAWRKRRKNEPVNDFDEMVLVLLMTCLISPLTWTHHYVASLPAFAILLRTGTAQDKIILLAGLVFLSPIVMQPISLAEQWTLISFLGSSMQALGGLLLYSVLIYRHFRNPT